MALKTATEVKLEDQNTGVQLAHCQDHKRQVYFKRKISGANIVLAKN
jgi:hypothetical protein